MSEFEVTGQPAVHVCVDRATVLRWVADAIEETAPGSARLLRRAADKAEPPAPMVEPQLNTLYEFITLVAGEPVGTEVGWWDGRHWVACFGRGMWSPQYVTGFRPYKASS